ncbi:MAG: AAA family ATPase, partial [Chlamydiia bacterium]|nr:AAA family ATPase [Chlamydiia bacterium]
KDVEEICRLCQTKYTELTPRGLMEIRRQYVGGMQGIQQIGTSYTYYKPPHFLKKWLAVDGVMFNDYSIPDELVPRGLMLSGAAGTGKTLGAKYLANSLGVPLYRLDLGALLGKYIGESEANLSKALAIADNAQPCVISHTKINTTVGDLDISEIYDRQELETFYCNTLDPETSLSVVTKVHRVLRKKGKKCLRITTNTGVIECTTDHKLLCVQDGLNVWVKAKDFKVGDDIIEVNYG